MRQPEQEFIADLVAVFIAAGQDPTPIDVEDAYIVYGALLEHGIPASSLTSARILHCSAAARNAVQALPVTDREGRRKVAFDALLSI